MISKTFLSVYNVYVCGEQSHSEPPFMSGLINTFQEVGGEPPLASILLGVRTSSVSITFSRIPRSILGNTCVEWIFGWAYI